jgi:Zn-finger nucleic acid-binding protein
VTFQRDGTTVVINGVPADICPQCGERYYDTGTTERLLAMAKEAARPGITLELREYVVA